MKIFDVDNRKLISVFKKVIFEKLNLQAISIKFVGGGSNGKVFKVKLSDNRVLALKAYRVQGAMEEEIYPLALLSENIPYEMPEVIFTYSDSECEFAAMSFIKGRNVLNPLFLLKSKKKKEAFAKAVVSSMLIWHSRVGDKYGNLQNPQYDSWLKFYKKEMQLPWLKGLSDLAEKNKFNKKHLKLLLEATDLFNKVCEEPTSPVLIHGDFNIMNMMADLKTFNVTGFIDPGGSMWADREYDLFQLRNMWGDCFGLYEKYKQIAGLSQCSDFRVAYYGAMNEAHCRLGGGLIMPVWEILWNIKLKREMKKLKEMM